MEVALTLTIISNPPCHSEAFCQWRTKYTHHFRNQPFHSYLNWRQWKYITFGTHLPAFASYKPQLFDVDTDPDEMHDVAEVRT